MRPLRVFGAQMLLVVPGCSFPSAASVVGEFASESKPIVGLVGVVGRSLRIVMHVGWGFEVSLELQTAFGNSPERREYY